MEIWYIDIIGYLGVCSLKQIVKLQMDSQNCLFEENHVTSSYRTPHKYAYKFQTRRHIILDLLLFLPL